MLLHSPSWCYRVSASKSTDIAVHVTSLSIAYEFRRWQLYSLTYINDTSYFSSHSIRCLLCILLNHNKLFATTSCPNITPNFPCKTSNRWIWAGQANICFNSSLLKKFLPPGPTLCLFLSSTSLNASKMKNVLLLYRLANHGPVPGSWLTPLLMSRKKAATESSWPGFASSQMR